MHCPSRSNPKPASLTSWMAPSRLRLRCWTAPGGDARLGDAARWKHGRALAKRSRFAQAGLSLIELTIFIAIVGVAIAGVLLVYNQAVHGSSDPLVSEHASWALSRIKP